ncbi:MAG: carboxypeptidase regulatory-like domain-containing protein [Acidimicrobiales bacterium]|nr:carboxypeptidase regulatory-like domain-containing protein [Acidimicrobiales bacterium]
MIRRRSTGRIRHALLVATALVAVLVVPGPASPAVADGNETPDAAPASRSISTGYGHSCAIFSTGVVRCWGANGVGQLGNGATGSQGTVPEQMHLGLPDTALGTGRTATAITAGGNHTCALLDDGTVKCWGLNDKGQLGLGDTANRGDGPGEMGDTLPTIALGTGRTATAITAGALHTCAILDTQAVRCWGESLHGRLGLGDTEDRGDEPGEMGDLLPSVALGAGRTATAITAGGNHTCALLDDDHVKCWGLNNVSQLGIPGVYRGDQPGEMGDALPPLNLGSAHTVDAVTAGEFHSCALLDDGAVKCWGDNNSGELGVGDAADHLAEGDAHRAAAFLGPAILGNIRGSGGEGLDGGLVAALRPDEFSVAGGAGADSNGMFAFAVPPGTYYLYGIEPTGAYKPGFHGDPYEIVVGTGTTVAGPTLAPSGGTVAGRVTELGSGQPLAGALTMSLNALGGPEAAATTNSNGEYAIGALRNGTHYLVTVDLSGAHAPRFHPSAGDVPSSTPAVTTAGATTTSDAVLPAQAPPGSAAAIVGNVTDTAGQPLSSVLVAALRADTYSLARATRTNANGGYSLPLSPGTYRIGFIDPTGLHEREWFDDQPVDRLDNSAVVAAPGTASAALRPTTGSLRGTVSDDVAAVGGAWVVAIGPSGIAGADTTDVDGDYRIDGLAPGNYRAAIVDPAAGRALYWDGASVYDEGTVFPVTAGQVAPVDPTL